MRALYKLTFLIISISLFSYSGCRKDKEDEVVWVEYDKRVVLYTETVDFGHSFISVGEGDDLVVYTYGRYGLLDSLIEWNGMDIAPTGEGILIRLETSDAEEYIERKMIKDDARAFQVNWTNPDKIMWYYDNLFLSSDSIPQQGYYAHDERARVINTYHILNMNCTTILHDGLEYSDAPYQALRPNMPGNFAIYKPSSLQADLIKKSNQPDGIIEEITHELMTFSED